MYLSLLIILEGISILNPNSFRFFFLIISYNIDKWYIYGVNNWFNIFSSISFTSENKYVHSSLLVFNELKLKVVPSNILYINSGKYEISAEKRDKLNAVIELL